MLAEIIKDSQTIKVSPLQDVPKSASKKIRGKEEKGKGLGRGKEEGKER